MVSIKQATRKLKKQYYQKNRNSILKREKQRYSTDQAYRDSKIDSDKQRYYNNVVYRHAKIDSDKQRYYNDEVYRHATIEKAKKKSKELYDNDIDYRNKHKKKVATRIMGRYWGDKSYNEKIKFSARLYRRTHKDKGKNYIQKYKKMAKMQADLRKLRNILRMFYQDHEKYSKLQIKILFERADAVEKSARNALAKLHSNIQKKCCQFNEKLPRYGLATAEQFIDAMENVRQHSEYTEAYFFENSYINFGRSNCSLCSSNKNIYTSIPINSEGKAMFFNYGENEPVRVISKCVCKTNDLEQIPGTPTQEKSISNCVLNSSFSSTEYLAKNSLCSRTNCPEKYETTIEECSESRSDKEIMMAEVTYNNLSKHSKPKIGQQVTWQCHPDICKLYPTDIELCQILFDILENNIALKFSTDKVVNFYLGGLDYCEINYRDTRKHGHSLYCSPNEGCQSYLRSLRALAPHFPVLNCFINSVYKAVSKCKIIQHINLLKVEGSYKELSHYIEEVSSRLCRNNSQDFIYGDSNIRVSVDENTIIKLFGESLDKVANIRDVYPTMHCDSCEQIKTKYQLKSLRSLSNKKGFDGMIATILEHLQQDIPKSGLQR